ncbi:MAG: NAD-dependent epimerase [Candidatus Vogelbacteria bacterium CG10_big_fil_rev_8_21_14_0_10_51_16]|uniref:NAD-dependent epimerase n=1 Tax=Candidatus Vogelbacteria bacterium CG10_big_fil_rev_8_21_14_0_10_51_16 TaxID=1975045 RepID=A0A2H0REL5_9BACT|nr:MAG: NAD-dependent epimerase [Candidatus Vogelbacteria bacterium CG10_big_fil_rev_8_21_14_0_10_51_16]
MKTYLVTGVAGFIGSAIARKLLESGHKVVGIDNFLTGLKENIPSKAKFFKADISKMGELKALNKFKFDAVLHLAAQTSAEISFENPTKDLLINSLGTLNLLEYCKDHKVKRFIYASSTSIYGDVDEKPVSITRAANPKSYYGITKLAGEHYVQTFSDRMNTTIFRIFNVYGPGQNMGNLKQGMVSIYMYYFMKNKPVIVKGSKDRFRDFTYIDDIVNAWAKAIDAPKTYGKTYNLAAGKKTTVEQLLKHVALSWGKPSYPIEYVGGTPKDQFGSYADVKPIIRDLNWKPRVGLKEGLDNFVKWAKDNSERW